MTTLTWKAGGAISSHVTQWRSQGNASQTWERWRDRRREGTSEVVEKRTDLVTRIFFAIVHSAIRSISLCLHSSLWSKTLKAISFAECIGLSHQICRPDTLTVIQINRVPDQVIAWVLRLTNKLPFRFKAKLQLGLVEVADNLYCAGGGSPDSGLGEAVHCLRLYFGTWQW